MISFTFPSFDFPLLGNMPELSIWIQLFEEYFPNFVNNVETLINKKYLFAAIRKYSIAECTQLQSSQQTIFDESIIAEPVYLQSASLKEKINYDGLLPIGMQAIQNVEVVLLTVAGGFIAILGFDVQKGLLRITPIACREIWFENNCLLKFKNAIVYDTHETFRRGQTRRLLRLLNAADAACKIERQLREVCNTIFEVSPLFAFNCYDFFNRMKATT